VSIPGRGNSSKRPDGNPSGQVVSFTRGAADRIAKVVRTVERGDTSAQGLTFGRPPQSPGGSEVRFAVWTATTNWSVLAFGGATTTNNTKVIQFAFPTATQAQGTAIITVAGGPTAMCSNHLAFIPILSTVATVAAQNIVVLKEAGEWRLIGAQA
jgi:hypothetical protein